MEKATDTAVWVMIGFALGAWFAVSALTHDEVVRNRPCGGCAKKLREDNNNG